MSLKLSLRTLPKWQYSSFRYFEKHERHVSRTYALDVLVMVFEGVLRFTEDGVPVEVHPGEYYIQRHGLRQEGQYESDSPKYFFIQWWGHDFTEEKDGLPLRGKVDFATLFPLFQELDTLRITGAPLVEISAAFYKVLSVLRRGSTVESASDVVAKVIAEVAKDIRTPFSLTEVASRCGYSKNHVINIFKRETGKTPYAFVNHMKVEMAKQLLLNSESSLSSIGIECGFGSYLNMYRTFIKAEGCPPADWKRMHAKE